MERILLSLEEFVEKMNEELVKHPDYIPGMKVIKILPELKYSYAIYDPTRNPDKQIPVEERMRADKVFEEVEAIVNERYKLIRS